jgi:hypothetical protein
VKDPRANPNTFVEVEPARSPPCTPAGTFTFKFGHMIERRTRRRPAACSRFAFACWIAGFFSSVVFRTASRVTASPARANQTTAIPRTNRVAFSAFFAGRGGSAAPRAMPINAAVPPDFNIEVRAGLVLGTARSTCPCPFIAGSILPADGPRRAPVFRAGVSNGWKRSRALPECCRRRGRAGPARHCADKSRSTALFACG